jgi:hypothetical protein
MRKSLFSLALALTIMLSIVAIAPVQTAEAVASGGVTVTCNVLTQEATITLPNNGCTDVVFTQGAAMVSRHIDFGFGTATLGDGDWAYTITGSNSGSGTVSCSPVAEPAPEVPAINDGRANPYDVDALAALFNTANGLEIYNADGVFVKLVTVDMLTDAPGEMLYQTEDGFARLYHLYDNLYQLNFGPVDGVEYVVIFNTDLQIVDTYSFS